MSISSAPLPPTRPSLKTASTAFRKQQTAITREVRKVIVGQEEVIEHVLISLFVGGHCLLRACRHGQDAAGADDGADAGLKVQPDPVHAGSDAVGHTGTDIIEEDPATGHRTWTFVPGPIFSNVLLADEINRTPPKTQSALLEAMQEAVLHGARPPISD